MVGLSISGTPLKAIKRIVEAQCVSEEDHGCLVMPLWNPKRPKVLVVSESQVLIIRLEKALKRSAPRCEIEPLRIPDSLNLQEPIIILSAPRSGSTLLFETLSKAPEAWNMRRESHDILEFGRTIGDEGNVLKANDVSEKNASFIRKCFAAAAFSREGLAYADIASSKYQSIRLIEKTPKNALRVSFLNKIFPDAKFIFLYRDPIPCISSIMDGWRKQHGFGQYMVDGFEWKFVLPPSWRELLDKPLAEIATTQWRVCNENIVRSLNGLPTSRWIALSYEDLVQDPKREIERLCHFGSLALDEQFVTMLDRPLPLSRTTVTPPDSTKFLRNLESIEPYLNQTDSAVRGYAALRQMKRG